ncbi:MAG: DsbA family protein, partial [Deltaproteobacteria bacterium]
GLDIAKWKADMDGKAVEAEIQTDMRDGSQLGANGTPAFFINGKKLVGAQPAEAFEKVIDAEIQHADDLISHGVKPDQVYAEIMKNARTSPPPAAQQAKNDQKPASQVRKVEVGNGWVKGPKDAKVTIVEFSDYQCPFCGRVEPTIAQIEKSYPKDVRIVWRNEPLPFHPNAMPAAEAAEAAGAQGKFWQMHDLLFQNQRDLSPANYEKWAQQLGLNMAKFKADVASHKAKDKIEADNKYAQSVGASGTPNFFIDGRQLVGAQPFEQFKSIIDDEIKKADALLKKGVKPAKLYEVELEENLKAQPQGPTAAAGGPPAPTERKNVEVGNSPARGAPRAPVTIVEFSDFQCPFCSRVEPTLTQIEKDYGDKVKVVWKNQPLPFHPNAMPAAKAAMAAREQGKFWEMHDLLFQNQRDLSDANYDKWAQQLGLDMSKFKADASSQKVADEIQADMKEGASLGANGTPNFFINGHQLVGAQPVEQFKAVIDEELKNSQKPMAQKGSRRQHG